MGDGDTLRSIPRTSGVYKSKQIIQIFYMTYNKFKAFNTANELIFKYSF
jgi:hypothetical protein